MHGKRSLLEKMWGTYEEKFAELRILYAYMYAHPGKKSLFMGGEFGQFVEWRFAEQLDWMLDKYELHRKMSKYCEKINKFYKEHKAFYEIECERSGEWKGFKWLNAGDCDNSVLSFMRIDASGKEKIAVVINFTPVERKKYKIGVPYYGDYETVLSSNSKSFGGDGKGTKMCKAKNVPADGYEYSINLDLKPLTAMYLKCVEKPLEKHKRKK